MFSNNQKNLKNVYGSHKNIPHELVLKMHKFALDLKKKGYGQRTIAREIQNVFRVNLSENTVSGWIHRHTIPFTNEKTQFKPKPIPPKKELYDFYFKRRFEDIYTYCKKDVELTIKIYKRMLFIA